MLLNKMSQKIIIFLFVSCFISNCKGELSNERLCGDPTCSEQLSFAKTLLRYNSKDARILSFPKNVEVIVFSKSAGTKLDLWGVQIGGKRGYAPHSFLREYRVLKNPTYVVSTDDSKLNKVPDIPQDADQVGKDSDKREVPPMTANDANSIDGTSEVKEEIHPTTETLKPYEVADGTTLYYNTEVPIEPLEVKATSTASNIEPTMSYHSDLKSESIEVPSSSLVLPQPTTSSEVYTEAAEEEGSTGEKIYKYLVSNFLSEEASGESSVESTVPPPLHSDKKSDEDVLPVESLPPSEKGSIDSKESSNIGHNIDANTQYNVSAMTNDKAPEPTVSTDNIGPSQIQSVSAEDLKIENKLIDSKSDTLELTQKEFPSVKDVEMEGDEDIEDEGDDDDDDDDDDEGDEGGDDDHDGYVDIGDSEEEVADSDQSKSDSKSQVPIDSTLLNVETSNVENGTVLSVESISQNESHIKHKSENQEPNLEEQLLNKDIKAEQEIPKVIEPELPPEIIGDATESKQSEYPSEAVASTLAPENVNGNHMEGLQTEQNVNVSPEPIVDSSNMVVNDVPHNDNAVHGVENRLHAENVDQAVFPNSDKTNDLNNDPTLPPSSQVQKIDEVSKEMVEDKGSVVLSGNEEVHATDSNLLTEFSNHDGDDLTLQENTSLDANQGTPHAQDEANGAMAGNLSGNEQFINDSQSDNSNISDNNGMATENPTESYTISETDIDVPNDESVLSTTTSTEDFSTSASYKNDVVEDSPPSVPLDIPPVDVESVSDDSSDDAASSSEQGFFSNIFGSWLSSSPSSQDTEDIKLSVNPVDNDGPEPEDGARNSVWSSVHSYSKHAVDIVASSGKESSPSCFVESGMSPECDKVLLAGRISNVASDNEAVLQEIIPEQGVAGASTMDSWFDGSNYGSLSYLGIITAISAVVVILGHWIIEKMRCDSSFIKKINELERALLYAELELKNLKIDLEESEQSMTGEKDSEKVAALEEQLKTTLEIHSSLEEKNAALEEKNANLQTSLDSATEAGLELNRMLSELLSANKGSESLIVSVNDLQQQLNSQQTTINNMKVVLTTKEAESESLRNNITVLQGTINNLERELNQMTETLNEVLVEKASQENLFKEFRDDFDAKLKVKNESEIELLKDISNLRHSILKFESDSCTKDMEIILLQQYIRSLKDNNSETNQSLKDLFDVAKANTTCQQLTTEKEKLAEELAGEKDALKLMEAHTKIITSEVESLRKAFAQSEKEKNEAVTKHAVLADYFKDKESQLHKELGYRDALYMKTKGDATSKHEEVKAFHEQLESYKSQNETLKKEIADQERGFKSQILAFEKKSHENWLAARQAERRLQESKLEAGQLRNRLLMVEKNIANPLNDKPIGDAVIDRDPMDPSGVGSPSPQLFPGMESPAPGDVMGGSPFAPRKQPPSRSPLVPLVPEEGAYRSRWSHGSPSPGRPHMPLPLPPAPHKGPANLSVVTFTVEEARDPASPFFRLLSPDAPVHPLYGRPIQDRHKPDVYHLVPMVPYMPGASPLILPPPPVLPSHDRRPPPLGRMSSPPADRGSPPYERFSPQRGPRFRSPDRERGRRHRGDRGSADSASPPSSPPGRGRERRRSPSPLSETDRSLPPSPGPQQRRQYRHRSRTPSGRYSDSSPDSGPDSRHFPRRYDLHMPLDQTPGSHQMSKGQSDGPVGLMNRPGQMDTEADYNGSFKKHQDFLL